MHTRSQEAVLEKIFRRTTHGIRFGLDRIAQAAAEVGNPHHAFKSFHIAGTNGKGSVCAYLDSVLRMQGCTTGMFTSPHIVRFEERFLVNGKCVHGDEWLEVFRDIEFLVDKYELSFFEIATLIAFELFRRRGVKRAVIETGMGGRLDATNIVTPEVAVVTAVGKDHTEYLGSDMVTIAKEKLGIVKAGIPLVISGQNSREVIEAAQAVCRENNVSCTIADNTEIVAVDEGEKGVSFVYRGVNIQTPLKGACQVYNALCAIKAMEVSGLYEETSIRQGIASTLLPGRFQQIRIRGKDIVFDVAHNPQAAEQLCQQIVHRFPEVPVCIVAGILRGKDVSGILRHYCSCAALLVLTRPDTSRAAEPSLLADLLPEDTAVDRIIKNTVKEAVDYACENFNGCICITGSFYTVGEAMTVLGIEPYA